MPNLAVIAVDSSYHGMPEKAVGLSTDIHLLSHTIEEVHRAQCVDRVAVCTGDVQAGAIAQQCGAQWIRRLVGRGSESSIRPENDLLNVLEVLRREGYEPELVIFLPLTSPIPGHRDVDLAVETLQREHADSLFSARTIRGLPWLSTGSTITPVGHHPAEQALPRRHVEETGSIYVFKPSVLRTHNSILGGRISAYITDPDSSDQAHGPLTTENIDQPAGMPMPIVSPPDLGDVRLLVLDFDGVLTDNRVLVNEDGVEAVWCHRGDGLGIAQIKRLGVDIIVISTETNPVVTARCRKLDVHCIQGCSDKLAALKALAKERRIGPDSIAYVGNDVNDLSCMEWVAMPIAVADAVEQIRMMSRAITSRRGGWGVVQEIASWFPSSVSLEAVIDDPGS